ncbi:hypothetical protein M1M10_31580 [Pseudomonas umsongensis]|nr:hypothetical protein [Pseudomonas umsongensis]
MHPKQFFAIHKNESLVQTTLKRMAPAECCGTRLLSITRNIVRAP